MQPKEDARQNCENITNATYQEVGGKGRGRLKAVDGRGAPLLWGFGRVVAPPAQILAQCSMLPLPPCWTVSQYALGLAAFKHSTAARGMHECRRGPQAQVKTAQRQQEDSLNVFEGHLLARPCSRDSDVNVKGGQAQQHLWLGLHPKALPDHVIAALWGGEGKRRQFRSGSLVPCCAQECFS